MKVVPVPAGKLTECSYMAAPFILLTNASIIDKSLFIRNRNKFVFIIYLQIFYDFYTHIVCIKYVQMI